MPGRGAVLAGMLGLVLLRLGLFRTWKRTAHPVGPRWLALLTARMMRLLASLCGISAQCDSAEAIPSRIDPDRQYMGSWHPHGALTVSAACYMNALSCMSTGRHPPALRNWFVAIADVLFRIPVLGELLVLWNCRSADADVTNALLRRGISVTVQPGGIPEQVITDCRREQAVFPPKLGWIRLAIQYGIPLLPIYGFGENQIFTTYDWARDRSIQLQLPLINPIPRRTQLHIKWGRPIEPVEQQAEPDQRQVLEMFGRYVNELLRLFDEHKAECLDPSVASRGLTVIWRGHSTAELAAVIGKSCSESLHIGTYPTGKAKGTRHVRSARAKQLRSDL